MIVSRPWLFALCLCLVVTACLCDGIDDDDDDNDDESFFPSRYPSLQISTSTNAKLTSMRPSSPTLVLHVREGETLNLTCSVVFGPSQGDEDEGDVATVPTKDYEINWYLTEAIMKRLTSVKLSNSYTVSIKDVVPSYSGPIRCSAKAVGRHDDDDSEVSEHRQMVQKIVIKVKRKPSSACGSSFFQCPQTSHCIGLRFICDGIEDCPDGSDESFQECGIDPCGAKLRCDNHRCMDPTLCCNPDVDSNCTFVPSCCRPLIDSNRHFYQMGMDKRRDKDDIRFLHSTIYTVLGCVMAFISLIVLVTVIVCRLHVRRNHLSTMHIGGGGGGSRSPPSLGTLHYLDVYFQSLYQQQQQHRHRTGGGITYNINNGVQIMTGQAPPPPYHHAAAAAADDPPPYEAVGNIEARGRVNYEEEEEELLNNNEENNNGDINGNSEIVNQNIVVQEAAEAAAAAATAAALAALIAGEANAAVVVVNRGADDDGDRSAQV